MSYYMGDRMGDYYGVGDPGIGSFFSKALGFGLGAVPVVGPALSKGVGALTKFRGIAKGVGGAIVKHPVLSAAGAAGAGMAIGGVAEHALMAAGAACPKGFHPCKSKHGCKKGPCVRNRHMRVTNPRALRRSIRRATGFAKLAMRTIHLVHPKKRGRFGGFRKRRRK